MANYHIHASWKATIYQYTVHDTLHCTFAMNCLLLINDINKKLFWLITYCIRINVNFILNKALQSIQTNRKKVFTPGQRDILAQVFLQAKSKAWMAKFQILAKTLSQIFQPNITNFSLQF